MDKETLDKIREVLKKHGLEEEEVSEVVSELTESAPADETPEDHVDETPAPVEDAPVEEGDKTPEGDVPPADEGDAEPAEPSEPDVKPEEDVVPPTDDEPVAPEAPKADLPEGVEEIDPANPPVDEPVEPVEPAVAPTPEVDPVIAELQGKLEESEKKSAGLEERIHLLEEALKSAGIMEETSKSESAEVGIDDPSRAPDYKDDAEIDLDDVVAELNKVRR